MTFNNFGIRMRSEFHHFLFESFQYGSLPIMVVMKIFSRYPSMVPVTFTTLNVGHLLFAHQAILSEPYDCDLQIVSYKCKELP